MTLCRLAEPPLELQAEADRLLDEWTETDSHLPFDEYLNIHASPSVLEYMKMMAGISDE